MIDIINFENQSDMGIYDTQTFQAANILSVQLGSLEYAPDLGIDLAYFLNEAIKFETESFKAYCVEVLARFGVNVTQVEQEDSTLFTKFNFDVEANETSTALIAR